MRTLIAKSAAAFVLGLFLITNPFSGVSAEGDPWNEPHTEASYAAGCSTGQGLEMSDCKLEYVTSDGAMFSWKTQWPSDTGYEVSGTPLRTDALTKLDKMGGQLAREHRVALQHVTIDDEHTYTVKANGSAPNAHGGTSNALTLRPRPSGAFAPSAELPANLPTRLSGTVTIPVEVAGDYRDVALFYALEGNNGSLATSYRVAVTKSGNQQGSVALAWDTTVVANGRYTVLAAAQNEQGYSLGWSVKKGVTVDNPATTCSANSPCNITVTNAADPLGGGFAPGAALTIYGERLSTTTQSASGGSVLPQELGNTRVWFDIDGVRTAGYLYFVSSYMINVQLPLDSMQSNVSFGTNRASIEAKVTVSTSQGTSESRSITIRPFAPALFTSSGTQGPVPAMLHASDSDPTKVVPVTDAPEAQRAHAGEVVMLYGTGMGLSTVTLPPRPYSFAGRSAVGKPFFELLRSDNDPMVKLFIGSRELTSNQVRFGFKSPFTVGIDQINFVVPADLKDGTYDIRICFATACSKVAKLPVTEKPARYANTVKTNSYVNGLSVDHAFAPAGGSVETADEDVVMDEPTAYPTFEPTPIPTEDCSYGWSDCYPPVDTMTSPDPFDPVTEEPAWAPVGDPWPTPEERLTPGSQGWDVSWNW